MYGYQVNCQMNSKEEDNYGDACVVGHTSKILIHLDRGKQSSQINH